jgi:hypothetical protein
MIENKEYGFNKLPLGEWKDAREYLSNPYVKARRRDERVAKARLRKLGSK